MDMNLALGIAGGISVVGTLALTLYQIRAARKEEVGQMVQTNKDVTEHFRGLAVTVADERIAALAVRQDIYKEHRVASAKEFAAVHEKLDAIQETMENGLADRIAAAVAQTLDEKRARLPIQRRKRKAEE